MGRVQASGDPLRMALRQTVAQALTDAQVPTGEVARRLGVTPPYVSDLRALNREISVPQARRVLAVLGLDLVIDVRVDVRPTLTPQPEQ